MRDAGILDTGIEIHESGIRESGIGNRESGYGIRDMGIWGYGDQGYEFRNNAHPRSRLQCFAESELTAHVSVNPSCWIRDQGYALRLLSDELYWSTCKRVSPTFSVRFAVDGW